MRGARGALPADSETARKSAQASDGFPYLMQLVGFQSWEQNPTAETITLEDVRFLQAMLDDERESRTTDIASRLGETTNYASTYKRRLIKRGVIGERGPISSPSSYQDSATTSWKSAAPSLTASTEV